MKMQQQRALRMQKDTAAELEEPAEDE